MKGFIYTVFALMISLIAILILFVSQNYSFQDSYPIYLLKDRIGYNILNVNGIDIHYQNGIIFKEEFPHTNLTVQLKKLELFYKDFTNYNISFKNVNYLKLYGPVNYSQISDNKSEIYFNSNEVTVLIYSNCNLVDSNYTNGSVKYNIKVYNSSGVIYSLSGTYKGYLNCTSFRFDFDDNKLLFNGSGNTTYYFNTSRGIILSNINYIIYYKGEKINTKMMVRT